MPDREENKRTKEEWKADFSAAVKDKKRWATGFIELAIACVLIAIDLLLKEFLYKKCVEDGPIVVIDGVFSFRAVQNKGASFGIFGDSTAALTAVSFVCAIALVFFLFYSAPRRNLWLRSSLILILGGAVGNLVDRLALQYVRDYVSFDLINFPVWNFADTCLTVGTVVLIIYILFFYSKEQEALDKARAERLKARREEKKAEESSLPESDTTVPTEVGIAPSTTEGAEDKAIPTDKDEEL